MPPRIKEEEMIEKIIRGLLKEPENKRCINCNSLGPQYVCTTFWTFVCTNCSGVHREFTHRVKSVSMAKFNAEEVSALQAGGNERARQIYFKTWDPQRNFYPDGSNLHWLREFIRHVYVERKFAGGNCSDRLSMVESDGRKVSYEPRSSEKSSWGGKDCNSERRPFEKGGKGGGDDTYEHCSFKKSSPVPRFDGKSLNDMEERSHPRYVQETVRPGGQRSRSTRFEIVDDRFRDDGNVKRYDRYGTRESRGESSSPSSRKSRDMNFPEICPVKDILGDKVPPLTICEPPNANATNQDSLDGNKVQHGIVNLSSLIDFDDNPGPQRQLKDSNKFDEDTANAAKVNTLESLLFEYSAPVSSPSAVEASSGATVDLISSSVDTDYGSRNATKIFDSSETVSAPKMDNDYIFPSNSRYPTEQITELHQQNLLPVLNDPKPVSNVLFDKQSQVDETGDQSMPNQRKELPADLFASDFTAFTPAVPGWQLRQPHVMQLQPLPTSTVAFPNVTKPSNPFDIGNERPQVQATVFPSMSSLQGALPNMPSGTFLQPHPSPYEISFFPLAAPYPINSPQGPYLGQQPNNMPYTSEQGISGGFNDPLASVNPIHQANREESWQAAPHTPSSRGVNPFG